MTIYVMPQAMVCDWTGESAFPNVDQFTYRDVEGHGSEKAFRYNGFEKTRSENPNIYHTYQSDTYLRMESLFNSGDLVVGDIFVLGIAAPQMTELDSLWVRQVNTVADFGLDIKVQDFTFADVGDAVSVDFSNACVDGRMTVNPVQRVTYDRTLPNAFSGQSELFWLVAEVTSLPAAGEFFTECDDSSLPVFEVRSHYNDSCITAGGNGQMCASQDTFDEWTAAIAALSAANDIVIWEDIAVQKRTGGFDQLK